MSERPILFSVPMVRAILEGRKTQTRRAIKPQPAGNDSYSYLLVTSRFQVGDHLWVKENLKYDWNSRLWLYRADDTPLPPGFELETPSPSRWPHGVCNSIHMARRLSRITLEITGVRVEHLQDISEADAIAEGIYNQTPSEADREWYKAYCADRMEEPDWADFEKGVWIAPGTRQGFGLTKEDKDRPQWGPTAAFAYRCLFEHINGPESWDANPWVWVVEFRRVTA